ncbi:MAG: nitroreductase family protein [bacterium]
MNTLEAIFSRRSIREFTDSPIASEQVETLLRAAMAAPSANNEQAWRFVVIRDRAVMNAIMEVHPYSQMLATAPLAVAVLGDRTRVTHPDYWIVDCSAATQNLLLAAHEMGLGAVWLGVFPRKKRMRDISRILHLPDHLLPLNVIALGVPAEIKPRVDRYRPEVVYTDRVPAGE